MNPNTSNTAVLITAIGSFSADIAIKTCRKMGFFVVGCDIYPAEWVVDSMNVDAFRQAPYVTKPAEYIAFLKEMCRKYPIRYILPSIDLEVDLLCGKKKEFEELGVTVCCSDEDCIRLCRDKGKLPFALKETEHVRRIPQEDAWQADPDALSYPAILKPVDGRSSEGCHMVENAEGFRYFRSLLEGRTLLVQPKIEGKIVTVDVVSDKKHAAALPRRELLRTGNGAGLTVEIFRNEELEAFCRESALMLGITGGVNFEFIEGKDGLYHFLEINPRFAGGVEFSHIAGYPIVEEHMKCFMGQEIDPMEEIRCLTIARKYEEYITKQ